MDDNAKISIADFGNILNAMSMKIVGMIAEVRALENLAKEYQDSIYDENVTKEDHTEISKEQLECISKLKDNIRDIEDLKVLIIKKLYPKGN
ncbi:MAG: hypothetical protein N2647_05530 [Thermodesulfovibrio sp.]|nr:hypothetical protein [Thermodesulfovibrio sp.]